ncbi:MAG: toxin-antitoxin system protein [Tannerellaceae bacterium]|jgi:predicted DNA-binding protein|nr:toxin-antitoxin system protein [Tannerellaceae bacterium]
MEVRAIKKQTAFRLSENLVDKLKAEAKKANRSLSNYVECILMESVFNEPNETTLAAMKEAENGDLETLDLPLTPLHI